MKAKLSIKEKIVCLSFNTKLIIDAGLENLTKGYYYNSSNFNWVNFMNTPKIQSNINDLMNFTIEDVYMYNIDSKNFNFDQHTLQAGDDIYFFPGTAVPRYKVKERGDELGFKTRKTPDKANIFVIDDKSLNKINYKRYNTTIKAMKYSNFKEFFNQLNIDVTEMLNQEQIDMCEFQNTIYADNSFALINNNLDSSTLNVRLETSYYSPSDYVLSSLYNEEQRKVLDFLNDICNDPNKTLMHSTGILEQINDKTDIDDKMYKRLNQMLETNDSASIELAMELMANVDLKKSLFYILLLLKDHNNKIRWSNSYNHSNFKAFRQSLGNLINDHRDSCFTSSLNGFNLISTLGRLKVLKKEHIDYFKEEIKRSFTYGEYSYLFTVSKIEANEKLKKMLVESSENLLSEEDNVENESV